MPNELRVFISSTFRDLQEEREHLVKKIFPEIRALCRQRGVTFTDIDLRWGLTEEQAVLGTVIRTCLEEVDKCRPYFIGIIGNRYGWAPEFHEIMMDAELLAKYPWIEDVAIEGASVTEMEFIHGVFDAPAVDGEYAFFYHRPGNLAEADDPVRLASVIERSRNSGKPFREFHNVEELGLQVRSDLVAMIERYWPVQEALTPLELQRRAHAAFAANRIRAYIPNPAYLKSFTTWLNESHAPLVIRGESGLGKSSLVAYLTEYYRKRNPTAFVVEHYVGAYQASGTAMSVMRHVIEEIRARFGVDEEIPVREAELQRRFPNWLYRCEHLAAEHGTSVLIVIDAVNQLGASDRRLSWLPKTIPSGVRLVVSTTPGEADDRLLEREWEQMDVVPVSDQRFRQSIVVRYLGEYHKGISAEQVRRVTDDAKASSPLYLRVVAEELRLHGEHETLDAVLDRYVGADDLLAVFDGVLERIEGDYGEPSVRSMLGLIAASRVGLSEIELMELTGMNRLDLSRLLFALDYHLIQNDGLLGFFHDYLRRAVERRYHSDTTVVQQFHERLIQLFASQPVSLRGTQNWIHSLESLGDRDGSLDVLSHIERFAVMWASEPETVMRLWASTETPTIARAYRASLDVWIHEEEPSRERRAMMLGSVAELLARVGGWEESEQLYREQLAELREAHDRLGESKALSSLSGLVRSRSRLQEALRLAIEAEAIAREFGDPKAIAYAVSYRGVAHWSRNEHSEALACYREFEEIARELGNRRNVSVAIGNRGLVHADRRENAEALACYREQEEILRELGDRQNLADALGCRGNLHFARGEYAEALACHQEEEEIHRELGDRRGIATVVGSRGIMHAVRGEYSEALARFGEQERLAREMGDRRQISIAVGNRGNVYGLRGEHDKALECFSEQEEIDRELGDRRRIAMAVGNRGIVHANRGENVEALACYQEQEEIARESGDHKGVALAVSNRGLVHANRREYADALDCFRQLEAERHVIDSPAQRIEWLEGIARVLVEVVEAGAEAPDILNEYIPEIQSLAPVHADEWRAKTLLHARAVAEECLAISRQLSAPETLFKSQALLARISTAQGDVEGARRQMETLLEEASEPTPPLDETDHPPYNALEKRAELHFRLWRINASDAAHRIEALRLYEVLRQWTPRPEYQERIEEMNASTTSDATDSAE